MFVAIACLPNPRSPGSGGTSGSERRLATVRGESGQKPVGLPARIRQLTSQADRKSRPRAPRFIAALVFSLKV